MQWLLHVPLQHSAVIGRIILDNSLLKYFWLTYLRRSPHWSDLHQKLCSKWRLRRNHVCQVSKWNFQGLQFYRGRVFHFPIDFWMGLTTALLVKPASIMKQNWNQFLLVVKAKQQISKLYPQILSTEETSFYIYDRPRTDINVVARRR